MQQRDQSRAALVRDAKFRSDKGPDLAYRARQSRLHKGDHSGLLLVAQLASAAARLKTRQPFEAILDKQAMPFADRVVVQKEHLGDPLAAQSIIQQRQRIGAPRQPMFHRPVPRQGDQVSPVLT